MADKIARITHFIPCSKNLMLRNLHVGRLLFRGVFNCMGFHCVDRGLICLLFLKDAKNCLEAIFLFFFAFPQNDRQIEVVNYGFGDFLRCIVGGQTR